MWYTFYCPLYIFFLNLGLQDHRFPSSFPIYTSFWLRLLVQGALFSIWLTSGNCKEKQLSNFCLSAVSIHQEYSDKNCVQFYYETQFFFSFYVSHSVALSWVEYISMPPGLGFPTQFSWIGSVWLEIRVCYFCAQASGAWHLTSLLVSLPLAMSWISHRSMEDERHEEQSRNVLAKGCWSRATHPHPAMLIRLRTGREIGQQHWWSWVRWVRNVLNNNQSPTTIVVIYQVIPVSLASLATTNSRLF